jgi:DNA-binding CsgD family transcriptional regulator
MQRGALVGTLEALYAIEDHPDDEDWMRAVIKAVPPLVPNALGTNGLMYDLNARPPKVWALVNEGSPLESEILAKAVESSTERYVNDMARTPVVAASEGPDFEQQPWLATLFRPRGIEDVLTLNAYNPVGGGCTITHAVSKRLSISKQQRRLLTRLSSHLAAASRLRFRLRRSKEKPEAILTPAGVAVHAEESAKPKSARNALREAARLIEQTRTRVPANPATTLDKWKPLVSAQWTLVEHFENDGKRYFLARANEPLPQGEDSLTPRERQIAALAALGHHTKLIAYELGVTDATVRVLLARAMRRVGAKSRAELFRIVTGSRPSS